MTKNRMTNIPLFPKFKALEASDKEEIKNFTIQFRPYSEFQFTTLYCWNIHEPVTLSWLNQNLVIFQSDCVTGKSHYSIIGNSKINQTIETLKEHIIYLNINVQIKWIPEETYLSAYGDFHEFTEDVSSHDYIYDVSKLYSMNGGEFSNYRRKINQFMRNNSNIEVRFPNLHISHNQLELKNLFFSWNDYKVNRGNLFSSMYEFQAFEKLLSSLEIFHSISTINLYVNNNLVGFAIVDFSYHDYAFIPFIKSNHDVKSSSQYLMNAVVNYLHSKKVKFINFEPDLGISSLKFSKQLYRPICFLKKYIVETTA